MNLEAYKQPVLKKERTSERAEILREILSTLNRERIGSPYPQMKPVQLAVKISHIPTEDLYFLVKSCQQSSNFSKCFWGSLKVRPTK
jgi:hypothetical protein